jgi:hypothetical protein
MTRPFEGEFVELQHNAIRSWLAITDDVILVGDKEAGAKKVAEEYGCRLIPCKRNKQGVKLVNDVVRVIRENAKYGTVLFTGAETIYFGEDLFCAMERVLDLDTCLVIGQRHDLMKRLGDFYPTEEAKKLLRGTGELHPGYCIEYFMFKGDPWGDDLPEFAAGRPGYDNCLVWKALDNKVYVIDATQVIWAGHQEHGSRHRSGFLADQNRKMMRDECGYAEVKGATWRMDRKGLYYAR